MLHHRGTYSQRKVVILIMNKVQLLPHYPKLETIAVSKVPRPMGLLFVYHIKNRDHKL